VDFAITGANDCVRMIDLNACYPWSLFNIPVSVV